MSRDNTDTPIGSVSENTDDDIPEELKDVLEAATKSEQEIKEQEEEYGPEWDGSEAQFVPDEDAADYEEQYPGIKLEYKLTREEIYECIKRAGLYKKFNIKNIIQAVLLIAAAIIFFVSFYMYQNMFNLVMGFVSTAVLIAIWLFPYISQKNMVDRNLNAKQTYVEVYPDEIIVGENKREIKIPLDGSCEFEEDDNMMMIFTEDKKVIGIPMRSIEPNVIADVQAMLIAGTQPRSSV